MAKSAATLSRAVLMQELETLITFGRALVDGALEGQHRLAEAAVARLEWRHAAAQILRHLPRGNVAAFADFSRAAGQPRFMLEPAVEEEAAHFKETMAAQIAVLDQVLTKLKNSRTRRLDQG